MTQRYRTLTLTLALMVLAIPALACGARPIVEAIPTATLVGDAPAFTVAAFAADTVQMLDGKTGRLLWKRQFPQDDHITGLLADGILYRSAQTDPVVTALCPDDGAILWQFRSCATASQPVTIAGGTAYVTCGGDQSTPTPRPYATPTTSLTPYATPTFNPTRVPTPYPPTGIIPTATPNIPLPVDDTLYALDAKSGQVRWRAPGHRFAAVFGGLVITVSFAGVQALSADSGKPLWAHTTVVLAHATLVSDPMRFFYFVVQADRDVIAYSPDGAHVEALRASDGQLLWRSAIPPQGLVDTTDWSVLAVTPSVVIAHGLHGAVVFDTTTGSIRWQRIDRPTAQYLSSAVSADGSIVYAGQPAKNFSQQLY